eukprot:g15627.t1
MREAPAGEVWTFDFLAQFNVGFPAQGPGERPQRGPPGPVASLVRVHLDRSAVSAARHDDETMLAEEEQLATTAEEATSIVAQQASSVWKILTQYISTKVGSSEAGRSSEEKAPGAGLGETTRRPVPYMWPYFLTRPHVFNLTTTSEPLDKKGRQNIRETQEHRLEAADLGDAHANIYFRLNPVPGQQDGPGRQMVTLVHDAHRDTEVNLKSLKEQLRIYVERAMST